MHGFYAIKVVERGKVLFEYSACTHPITGESITTPEGTTYGVGLVRHILKEERNGFERYTGFSHVEVQVG